MTIEDIRGFIWAGNFHDDRRRSDEVDSFVASDAPRAERLEALGILQREMMGEDSPISEEELEDYADYVRKMRASGQARLLRELHLPA